MSLGDGVVWSESLPDNSTLAHQIDDYNRDLRLGVRTRMAREHVWTSSQTATNEGGHHQFITFQQSTAAPTLSTALTQVGALFVGSSGDGYPLTFENSAGASTVVTRYDATSTLMSLAVVSAGTLGAIPICLATNPNALGVLVVPAATTASSLVLVATHNATGGVAASTWGQIAISSNLGSLGPLTGNYFNYSGTEKFNGTTPNIWTDLDLSSVVGANRVLVYLRVTCSVANQIVFRTNGDALSVGSDGNDLGVTGCTPPAGGGGFVLVMTDTAGIVEWGSLLNQGGTATVTVSGYIK